MNRKKMVAPVVITIILVLLLLVYLAAWSLMPAPSIVKLVFGLILVALIGVAVYNLLERMKEIRSGEEDDLSKY